MTTSDLAKLESMIQRIEDERAIERIVASYGPLVDAGEATATAELWSPDGRYDVEDWTMSGRSDIEAMVNSQEHQGLIARGCTHLLGPAVVTVRGDDAVAVCESVLLVKHGVTYYVARAGVNHFALQRSARGWEIVQRTTRRLDGTSFPRALLSRGVEGLPVQQSEQDPP
ncbi:nuclear transport factor 2 family protein [Mycobacteroides chelonae]|jgi:SnoaL-like domain|uniref:nuclear transport factor 2 family protein n=1 Tax=Mycobacteroides chelonae TaxID=1774 RepID=UPI0009BF0604|nr:nuclear transport factor 2 family protein [Mycobacteroides chelonae]QQG87908.1 nuclear transport factor 2 family protein [Mycobacteroides chelonae]QQG92725.1 nuclear transport factor 2 family protein [Mycobacteroides chelonae]